MNNNCSSYGKTNKKRFPRTFGSISWKQKVFSAKKSIHLLKVNSLVLTLSDAYNTKIERSNLF